MAGNHYGPGGRVVSTDAQKNRELEERIVKCLSDKLGTEYMEYTCLASNHFTGTGLSSNYVVLPTRDIIVNLWISKFPENRFTINYNTKDKTHSVHKQSIYYPDIKKEHLDKIIECITAQVGGAQQRHKSRRARRLRRVRTQRRR
jgi:hypothetical protein